MSVAIITGSAGLIGSEAVIHFANLGMKVVGIDNNMRAYFFGSDASNDPNRSRLLQTVKGYSHEEVDIRDAAGIDRIFQHYGNDIALVIHTAAQPSHDWAAREPLTDFGVNATGTLHLLEATRKYASQAVFIFTSTNKVYGDSPNQLPLVEKETRWDIDPSHPYVNGIPESMSLDQSLHSLFGASKVAADIMVQEYGRYFGMKTVCFRGGCLTGPHHAGAQLHGFLAYLMRCAVTEKPYTIFGYKGKQVRDNIHSADLISAFESFFRSPRSAEVYNIGGGLHSNCSMSEAVSMASQICGHPMKISYQENNRTGDHIWYVSDLRRFQNHYPAWKLRYNVEMILQEMYEINRDRWSSQRYD
jgi:CDP-paratose 2-epimerase